MKETQPQVLESTSKWPQKILALAPNLNRPLSTTAQPVREFILGIFDWYMRDTRVTLILNPNDTRTIRTIYPYISALYHVISSLYPRDTKAPSCCAVSPSTSAELHGRAVQPIPRAMAARKIDALFPKRKATALSGSKVLSAASYKSRDPVYGAHNDIGSGGGTIGASDSQPAALVSSGRPDLNEGDHVILGIIQAYLCCLHSPSLLHGSAMHSVHSAFAMCLKARCLKLLLARFDHCECSVFWSKLGDEPIFRFIMAYLCCLRLPSLRHGSAMHSLRCAFAMCLEMRCLKFPLAPIDHYGCSIFFSKLGDKSLPRFLRVFSVSFNVVNEINACWLIRVLHNILILPLRL